jgi:predicted nucleic acid-binding protein
MLLDSNLIIYAARPEHAELRRFIADRAPAVSAVSLVEVLGYHGLREGEAALLESFFAASHVLPVDDSVVRQAVALRQARRMTLGDALVAATALVHGHTLATHNTRDFRWIEGLSVIDPLTDEPRAG